MICIFYVFLKRKKLSQHNFSFGEERLVSLPGQVGKSEFSP